MDELGDGGVDVPSRIEEGGGHLFAQIGGELWDGHVVVVIVVEDEQGVREVEWDGAPAGSGVAEMVAVEGDALEALCERPGHGRGSALGLEEAHEGGAAARSVDAVQRADEFRDGGDVGLEFLKGEGPGVGEGDDGEGREGGELTRLVKGGSDVHVAVADEGGAEWEIREDGGDGGDEGGGSALRIGAIGGACGGGGSGLCCGGNEPTLRGRGACRCTNGVLNSESDGDVGRAQGAVDVEDGALIGVERVGHDERGALRGRGSGGEVANASLEEGVGA